MKGLVDSVCRSSVVASGLQTVERLEGLRPEVEDAVTAHLHDCLLESNLDLGQRTVVRLPYLLHFVQVETIMEFCSCKEEYKQELRTVRVHNITF